MFLSDRELWYRLEEEEGGREGWVFVVGFVPQCETFSKQSGTQFRHQGVPQGDFEV